LEVNMSNILLAKCLAAVLGLVVLALGSCNIVSNIPGNVAGQLVNETGQGRGFISVQLYDVATNQMMYAETANDSGNFMFKTVDPGEYIIVAKPIGGGELNSDAKPFKLAPGKTLTITVIIYQDEEPPGE